MSASEQVVRSALPAKRVRPTAAGGAFAPSATAGTGRDSCAYGRHVKIPDAGQNPFPELDLSSGLARGFDRRALPVRLGILAALLVAALLDYGHEGRAGHWIVLLAYGAATIAAAVGTYSRSKRVATALPVATTAFDAAVAVYVIADHIEPAGSLAHATDSIAALPAYLFLIQTGMRLRPRLVALFGMLVLSGWAAVAAFAVMSDAPQAHQAMAGELLRLIPFAAAAGFVLYAAWWTSRSATSTLRAWRERVLLARFLPGGVDDFVTRGAGHAIHERRATVLAVDLRGSSAMARDYPAEVFVSWLLDMRGIVHDAVTSAGGIVDKYMGDGVLALFLSGDATSQADAALAAVDEVASGMEALNRRRVAGGLPQLRVIASLHAGDLLAGVFDDGRRAEFTVLGPCMNDLSRIERRAKSAGADIVASLDVVSSLSPSVVLRWESARLVPQSQQGRLPEILTLRRKPFPDPSVGQQPA